MPRQAEFHLDKNIHNAAYADLLEHLADELGCLDLRIHLLVRKQQIKGKSNPLEQFRGLVLSEEEISELLEHTIGHRSGDNSDQSADPDLQAIKAALAKIENKINERRLASHEQNTFLPLVHLSKTFHLSRFEEQCLIICLAPELERKYEKLYAYLNDDISSKRPTTGLVLDLLCTTFQQKVAARTVFNQQSTLLKQRFLQFAENQPQSSVAFPSRQLKLDDRIADYLLCCSRLDSRLNSLARLLTPEEHTDLSDFVGDLHNKTCRFIHSHLSQNKMAGKNLIFLCNGPTGSGKNKLVEAVSRSLGLKLLVADSWKMFKGTLPFEETAGLLGREAVLQPALLCLEGFDCLLAEDELLRNSLFKSVLEAVRNYSVITFVCSSRVWRPPALQSDDVVINLEFPVPDENARKQIWERCLRNSSQFADSTDSAILAGKFRFTSGQIRDSLALAHNLALWHSTDSGCDPSDLLYAACRAQAHSRLNALAYKVAPRYTRLDIVLPVDQMLQLMELCDQSRCRQIVYGEWGFGNKLSSGKGLTALFTGPPGTGKTMAAEVIANELKLELYKIDLSQIVSKYIGETEKNLERIFSEAQTSNAILFFDEADALFGKRSEVKDAHDRYANIEIGFLLQKMEEYEGIAILASNLRSNMDEAFTRRLQILIEFPFPDEEQREKIWKGVFPERLPLDAGIDISFLARQIKVTGGNIKNIAITAAFLAAADSGTLGMRHVIHATRREMQKMGRLCTKAELGEYYSMIEAQTPITGGWWQ